MERERRILDCGHEPSPHSACSTGTGHFTQDDGSTVEVCWDCCLEREKQEMLTSDRFLAYVSEDKESGGWKLTDWPGGLLGRVVSHHEVRNWLVRNGHFSNKLYYVLVRDVHGQTWYGYTGGPSLYVKLRKHKHQAVKPCAAPR